MPIYLQIVLLSRGTRWPGPSFSERKAPTMDACDCPDEQPSDPLKKFMDESLVFDNLQRIDSVCPLYYPNTRMKDFSGKSIILCQNFVPTDDPSITQQCVYTLGKNGHLNQRSICRPMRILGQCVRRYNPKNFLNVDAAVLSILVLSILDKVLFC